MNKGRTRTVSLLGIFLGIIWVLSFLENVMIPPIPGLPAGFHLGLSNILVMYTVFFISWKAAVPLVMLKSLFVVFLRNPTSAFISFCGGTLSILFIVLVSTIFKEKLSYLMYSILGAIFHNIGQVIGASIIAKSNLLFYLLPLLVISGVAAGAITGSAMKVLAPAFDRFTGKKSQKENSND